GTVELVLKVVSTRLQVLARLLLLLAALQLLREGVAESIKLGLRILVGRLERRARVLLVVKLALERLVVSLKLLEKLLELARGTLVVAEQLGQLLELVRELLVVLRLRVELLGGIVEAGLEVLKGALERSLL